MFHVLLSFVYSSDHHLAKRGFQKMPSNQSNQNQIPTVSPHRPISFTHRCSLYVHGQQRFLSGRSVCFADWTILNILSSPPSTHQSWILNQWFHWFLSESLCTFKGPVIPFTSVLLTSPKQFLPNFRPSRPRELLGSRFSWTQFNISLVTIAFEGLGRLGNKYVSFSLNVKKQARFTLNLIFLVLSAIAIVCLKPSVGRTISLHDYHFSFHEANIFTPWHPHQTRSAGLNAIGTWWMGSQKHMLLHPLLGNDSEEVVCLANLQHSKQVNPMGTNPVFLK